jgi:hypothetical protein
MGLSVASIGGIIGIFITASLTQWYYTKKYGANGLPCFPSERPLFSLDLGWGATQIHEIKEEIHDLSSRARMLERELAEIRLTRLALEKARDLGEEGQARLRELKQIKNLRKGLGKRIVGGIGHRIHRVGTRIKSPIRTLMMGHPIEDKHDIEHGESALIHEQEKEKDEEEIELREREQNIQEQLADVNTEKNLLEQIKVSEERNSD